MIPSYKLQIPQKRTKMQALLVTLHSEFGLIV